MRLVDVFIIIAYNYYYHKYGCVAYTSINTYKGMMPN